MKNDVKREYMTIAEFARIIGYTPQGVRKMIIQGRLKGAQVGTKWLIPVTELETLRKKTGENT